MKRITNTSKHNRKDIHVDDIYGKGLSKADCERAVEARINSNPINTAGDEPRILVDAKVPKEWKFETLGLLPYGWQTNPYDATRYDINGNLLYDVITRMWWDNVGHSKIRYDTEQQIPYYYDDTAGRWIPDRNKKGLLQTCNTFFALLQHACGCIDGAQYKKDFSKALVQPFQKNGGLNVINIILSGLSTISESNVTTRSFDKNPYMYNVHNGVINLKTGEFRAGHLPTDMMTRISNVDYDPNASAPRFAKFLSEIFPADPEKIKLVVRWFGYSLTGLTNEAKIFIMRGRGRNGKSVLENVIAAVAGDYAGQATEASLCLGGATGNNENLAGMDGKRLVFSNELSSDKQLNASMIKQLTGSDSVQASFKYGHLHTINVMAKITLWTNNIPRLRDDALISSGRIVVISFNRVFSPTQQNKNLTTELMSELPGILNMLIAGCRDYFVHNDLQIPKSVRDESAAVCHDNNQFGLFAQEHLKFTGSFDTDFIAGKELYARYQRYAKDEAGINPPSYPSFNSKLTDRGIYSTARTHRGGRYALYGWVWRGRNDPEMSDQEIQDAFEATRNYAYQLANKHAAASQP